jgi:hypothetical protein
MAPIRQEADATSRLRRGVKAESMTLALAGQENGKKADER